MGKKPTYTQEELLEKLEKHCIEEHLSKYTMAYPTWQCYLKRMAQSDSFADKVNNSLMVAEQWWERQGVEALNDKEYNNMMWTKMTNNKAFTKDHHALDMESRIKAMEDSAK